MTPRPVSTKNESVRFFESDFFERFSHVHPVTPVVVFLPVIAYTLYLSAGPRGLSIAATAGLFALGLLLWTLIEYAMHRYLFHYEPKSGWGKRIHFFVHGAHHDYPQDATRLVAPPAFSIPVSLVFYGLFLAIFGRLAPGTFAGFIFGYVCYDMIHYATHHFSMKGGVGLWLKQYHMRHHFKDDHHGFGVSSPLWDYVFGTRGRRAPLETRSLGHSGEVVGTPDH
ncbi:MAG TPA: sterol desaturase family protein [Chthoniobacterales bacterium]|jgi:sterol desaturase/sphingolipid hydroxylase (fatty acid hydroxylase superfamily)|nr:sterol desaturase family protein [Chthoniobacterales bacterium]